jgi:hypothetical protein
MQDLKLVTPLLLLLLLLSRTSRSTGPMASPCQQLDAHQQTSSSVLIVRNERPPVESSSRGEDIATTEAASVTLMLCELKTTTMTITTTAMALEDSSAFVTRPVIHDCRIRSSLDTTKGLSHLAVSKDNL